MNGPPQTKPAGLQAQPTESVFKPIVASPMVLSLLLAAVTFVVFWPVFSCDFVKFDDPSYVTANSHVENGFTWEGIAWAFHTFHMGSWHPLTWMSHMLDVQL